MPRKPASPRCTRLQRNAGGDTGGGGGRRVAHVVQPRNLQRETDVSVRRRQIDLGTEAQQRVARRDVGAAVYAEGEHLAVRVELAPEIGMGIIGVDDRDPVFAQAFVDLAFLGGDRIEPAHPFEVGTAERC